MPLAVRTDPHFLPVGVTTGSTQEDGSRCRISSSGSLLSVWGLLLATGPQLSPLGCNDTKDSVLMGSQWVHMWREPEFIRRLLKYVVFI